MTNLIQKVGQSIKKGIQYSILIPVSAMLLNTTGCSTEQMNNIPYRGWQTRDKGSDGISYDLIFDWQKKEDRGSRDPELTLNGDPKMKTSDKDTLEIGRRYDVTYRTYWIGQNKIIKAEKADSTK